MIELNSGLSAAIAGDSIADITFSQPWMARAFAITLAASRSAQFTLADFQSALIAEINENEMSGNPIVDDEDYYSCWLKALTVLLSEKALLTSPALEAAEIRVQERLASLQHDHDHHSHNIEHIQPVYSEKGRHH